MAIFSAVTSISGHNGNFYTRHPAGEVFKNFFGDNFLYADVSDTIPELGDTLTHGGTPLTAEKQAATLTDRFRERTLFAITSLDYYRC